MRQLGVFCNLKMYGAPENNLSPNKPLAPQAFRVSRSIR